MGCWTRNRRALSLHWTSRCRCLVLYLDSWTQSTSLLCQLSTARRAQYALAQFGLALGLGSTHLSTRQGFTQRFLVEFLNISNSFEILKFQILSGFYGNIHCVSCVHNSLLLVDDCRGRLDCVNRTVAEVLADCRPCLPRPAQHLLGPEDLSEACPRV